MPQDLQYEIDNIIEEINKVVDVDKIYLFGSYAYGNPKNDSDLDGGGILRTHDLTILNKICSKYNEIFKELDEDCIELVDYGVHVRYPFHIDLEEYDMKKALESDHNIENLINKVIN
ncbi:MAG: nucleotidyltransferase domain-containing protein [Terrisporobacter sp.]